MTPHKLIEMFPGFSFYYCEHNYDSVLKVLPFSTLLEVLLVVLLVSSFHPL